MRPAATLHTPHAPFSSVGKDSGGMFLGPRALRLLPLCLLNLVTNLAVKLNF